MKKEFNFKSLDKYYHKEKSGLKPNTVREIDLEDDRFIELIISNYEGFNKNDLKIIITNSETGESFRRNIEDITIYKNLIIISWRDKQ